MTFLLPPGIIGLSLHLYDMTVQTKGLVIWETVQDKKRDGMVSIQSFRYKSYGVFI